jgi:hypothetical protein
MTRRTGRWGPALALAAVLLAGAWTDHGREGQDALRALLPADGDAPGWSKDGEPQEFVGEDLYTYIDGGAEIYLEYGFRRVVAQDYRSSAGKSVSLEIFEMETPAAAYGIFTFKRSGQGTIVVLGLGAELEDYYLNFWSGRFLVTLTGFDATPPTLEGLRAVSRAVDAKIGKTNDEAPDLVAALPVSGLRPQSVKYLKGLLGLNNVYPFYTARGLAFAEAVKGDYGEGASLIILDYGSAEARVKAWAELETFLRGGDRFKKAEGPGAALPLYLDGKGRFAAFAEAGSRLAVAVGPVPDAAVGLAARALR